MEGGHGSCCRFATLTGVNEGAHTCLAKLWIKKKFGARTERRNAYPTVWTNLRGKGGSSCRFERILILFCGHNTDNFQKFLTPAIF